LSTSQLSSGTESLLSCIWKLDLYASCVLTLFDLLFL
jgi:hypothetical protein